MDLELRPLRFFLAVAEEKSFTGAAERMRVAQPTLSVQIRELEKLLGFSLFLRSTKRVEMTRQGAKFQTPAQKLIDESDRFGRAVKNLRQKSASQLRIGAAYYTIDIAERVKLIEDFIAANRWIQMTVDNDWQLELVRRLRRRELDLAFVIGSPIDVHDFARGKHLELGELLFPSDLERLVLRRERFELLVPRQSPLARFRMVPRKALSGARIAMLAHYHGAALLEKVTAHLTDAGAELGDTARGEWRRGRALREPVSYPGSEFGMVWGASADRHGAAANSRTRYFHRVVVASNTVAPARPGGGILELRAHLQSAQRPIDGKLRAP